MDLDLVGALATLRPDLQFVLLGPVVKIDEASLPQAPNLHWLGSKDYRALPEYLSGWDVAFMPFARNEATRFISPTKTPEFLAAGIPVVSTPITDVVQPYGAEGLVEIAGTAGEMSSVPFLTVTSFATVKVLPVVTEYTRSPATVKLYATAAVTSIVTVLPALMVTLSVAVGTAPLDQVEAALHKPVAMDVTLPAGFVDWLALNAED